MCAHTWVSLLTEAVAPYFGEASWLVSSRSLVSALRALGLKMSSTVPSRYVGAGNLKSGPHSSGQACIDWAVSPAPTGLVLSLLPVIKVSLIKVLIIVRL